MDVNTVDSNSPPVVSYCTRVPLVLHSGSPELADHLDSTGVDSCLTRLKPAIQKIMIDATLGERSDIDGVAGSAEPVLKLVPAISGGRYTRLFARSQWEVPRLYSSGPELLEAK